MWKSWRMSGKEGGEGVEKAVGIEKAEVEGGENEEERFGEGVAERQSQKTEGKEDEGEKENQKMVEEGWEMCEERDDVEIGVKIEREVVRKIEEEVEGEVEELRVRWKVGRREKEEEGEGQLG